MIEELEKSPFDGMTHMECFESRLKHFRDTANIKNLSRVCLLLLQLVVRCVSCFVLDPSIEEVFFKGQCTAERFALLYARHERLTAPTINRLTSMSQTLFSRAMQHMECTGWLKDRLNQESFGLELMDSKDRVIHLFKSKLYLHLETGRWPPCGEDRDSNDMSYSPIMQDSGLVEYEYTTLPDLRDNFSGSEYRDF